MKRVLVSTLLALTLIVTCFTPATYAAAKGGTKKMTVYNDVIKKSNTAYCSTPLGIYKVNIKKGKKSRIVKLSADEQQGSPIGMSLKGNFLYYLYGSGDGINLNRVKTNGKGRKDLVIVYESYVIKGKKIYYNGLGRGDYDGNWVANLNGKGVKKTKIKTKNTWRSSNKKGYRVIYKKAGRVYDRDYEDYVHKYNAYLKTPKKSIYLCTFKGDFDF